MIKHSREEKWLDKVQKLKAILNPLLNARRQEKMTLTNILWTSIK
jgi:hypothetical protein